MCQDIIFLIDKYYFSRSGVEVLLKTQIMTIPDICFRLISTMTLLLAFTSTDGENPSILHTGNS